MRITTKTRYGTRALLELALHQDEGPLSLAEIARRQELSEKYAESLMGRLRAAGVVHSVRGAQGGYLLARDPAAITVREVYEVMEGVAPPVACLEDAGLCSRVDQCVTQEVWGQMQQAALEVLGGVTLADLAERYRRRLAARPADFAI